jgi:hypothetical protein
MRKVLSGLCALVLLTGLAAACNDSKPVGENPTRDRTPSASPPTAPPTSSDTGGTMGSSPSGSPAPGREAPKSTPTMPNR